MRRWRDLARSDRGGVSLIAAGGLTMMIGCLAFAVDLGSIYLDSRRLQGIADAAALAAAANLSTPQQAAESAVSANHWRDAVMVDVATGRYRADAVLAARQRFVAGLVGPDAVRVTLSTETPVFFGLAAIGRDRVTIRREATAARIRLASFSIGSRLAALNGGVANQLLSGLTGSSANLSVMDYNALLAADIDLFAFTEALRTELDLEGASFDEVLATDLSVGRAIGVMARLFEAGGDNAAGAALRLLSNAARNGNTAPLPKLIDFGPYGPRDTAPPGFGAEVNAFEMARTLIELAAPQRQVQINLGGSVPGIASTRLWVAIGDRAADSPWVTVTDKGAPVIRTAQTRIYVEAGTQALAGLSLLSIKLPLLIELAEAEASLASIDCGGARQVALSVRPGIGHVAIAEVNTALLDDHGRALAENPANLARAPLITVTGKTRVDIGGNGWQTVRFDGADIAAGRVKQVSSGQIVGGLAASLVRGMTLNVSVGPLTIGAAAITSLVGSQLSLIAGPLDTLVDGVLATLGLSPGQADVRVTGIRCGAPVLVA
jgi:uncharacterized membrane protein